MNPVSIYWTAGKVLVALMVSGVTLAYMFLLSTSSIDKFLVGSSVVSEEYGINSYWTRMDHHRKMAEINQLSYVLTEKMRFLDAYKEHKKRLFENFLHLKKASRPEWMEQIASYERMVRKKFAMMDESIARREIGRVEAMQILFMGEGRVLSARLDEAFEKNIEALRSGLNERIKVSTLDAAHAESLLLKTCVICGCLFLVGGGVLLNDLRKRRNFEMALIAAEAKAVKSAEFKSQFLAHMSHEIRTPLNSILGMGEMLAETNLNEEQRKFISTFQRAGDSLLTIVNEILDLSKIEAGAMTFENAEFCISGLVEDVRTLSSARAGQKFLELKIVNSLRADQVAQGDPGRLRQVLLNLVGNAIKFTAQGSITVKVEDVGANRVKFSVVDTGVGLSEEACKRLFAPFQQADVSTSRLFGGTGLGLSISKQIVERMGGEIGVESSLGKGSTFWFQVPLLTSRSSEKKVSVEPPVEVQAPAQPLRILVADDIAENRELIHLFLRNFPYALVFAVNGQEALDKFKSDRFDMVFLDMQMPVMDGKEAVSRMRQYEREARIPVRTPIVAMTADVFDNALDECLKKGCDLRVSKPIKKKLLLNTIAQIMGENSDVISTKTA